MPPYSPGPGAGTMHGSFDFARGGSGVFGGGIATASGTSATANPQDRHIRMLEQSLEQSRAEVRQARERANNPEAMYELQRVQDELRREQIRSAELERDLVQARGLGVQARDLRSELDMVREQQRREGMAADAQMKTLQMELTDAQRELGMARDSLSFAGGVKEQLAQAQEDLRRAQGREGELRREIQATKDSSQLEYTVKMAGLQSDLANAQQTIRAREQEVQQKEAELRAKDQTLLHEKERARKDIERMQTTRDQLDAMLSDTRKQLEEVEQRASVLASETTSLGTQAKGKSDLIMLLEEEAKAQKQRLAQATELTAELRKELLTVEAACEEQKKATEAETARADDLNKRLETTEALRKETAEKHDSLRKLYDDVADRVGASEVQKSMGLVHVRIDEVLADKTSGQKELLEAQRVSGLGELAKQTLELQLKQAQAEVQAYKDAAAAKDTELSELRTELLDGTRQLRELTLTHDAVHREKYYQDERAHQLTEQIAQKEAQLEAMTRQLEQAAQQETVNTNELRRSLNRLQTDRDLEVSRLQQSLQASESTQQYADLCRRIGHLLSVDPTTTPAVHAQRLYSEVERLYREHREHIELARTSGGGFGGLGGTGGAAAAHNGVGGVDTLGQTAWLGGPDEMSGGNASALKTELRENEERWIKLRVEYDSFRREVARCLEVDELDADVLVDELRSHVKRHKHGHGHHHAHGHTEHKDKGKTKKHGSKDHGSSHHHHPHPDTTGHDDHHESRNHRGHHHHHHHHNEHDYQKLKKKLTTALQTIESQDLWIELLNRKLGGDGGGPDGVRQSGSRAASPTKAFASSEAVSAVKESEVAALKNEILDLEARLQKHIEFRERVIQTLGLKAISAPDYEILQAIDTLMTNVRRLERMDLPVRPTTGNLSVTAPHRYN